MNKLQEKCFALHDLKKCSALKHRLETCGTTDCPFYKPEGCKDWIRTESENGEIRIEPLEDYLERKEKEWSLLQL